MAYRKLTEDKKKILHQGRECWKHAYDADAPQRLEEKEDLSFQMPSNQWTEDAKKERKGRPTLSASKLDQPAQLVYNQERAAKLGVNAHPLNEDADDDTAEVIQGLYRHIERDSRASQARSSAFQRAVWCGRGYWRVNCEWDDEGGFPFDQKIVIKRIPYQGAVLFDPSSSEPDGSDAEYVFVESWLDEDTYKREFPESELPTTGLGFEAYDKEAPGWSEIQGSKRCYRVVEYWYKVHEKETIVMLENGAVVPKKDVPEDARIMLDRRGNPVERDRDVVRVKFCKLSGNDVLDQVDWDGQYIPIIRLVGRPIQSFDATSSNRYVGLVNHAKDSQRFFNYAVSTYVERMAMEPKAPVVGYAGQFEGFEMEWDQINSKNLTRLEVNPVVDKATNQVLPLPQRLQIDLTGTSLAGQAMQIADGLIQSTTTVYDAGLGRLTEDTRKSSGRALLALQQQADASTSDFLQNLADAMSYEARIIIDLLPYKYDREGRVTRILRGDDDKAESVILNQPFAVVDGKPVPITQGNQEPDQGKHYDLKNGKYGVSVSIGKSFQSRLEHGSEFMTTILEKMPQLLPVLGDLVFKFRDDPGASEISKRLAKVREQQFPGLGEGEDGQPSPEQLQTQNQGLQQQLQVLQSQLQAAAQALETDKAKQEADIVRTQMANQTTLQKAEMDNMTKMAIERAKQEQTAVSAGFERLMLQIEQRFEAIQNALDRRQELRIHHEEMAHDVGMARAGGQTFSRHVERGSETGQEREQETSQGASSESIEESSAEPQADGAGE